MKKRILIISGGVILVLLLAGAAFVGGRLLNGQGLPVVSSGGSGGIQIKMGGGGPATQLDIQPAKELPQTPADVRGLFDHRQNNSIYVGTGNVKMTAQKDQSGEVTTSTSHDGPTVDVVVTNQTTVYHDATLEQFNGPPPAGQKIQQVLEPGVLEDIGQSSMITVWGKKTGDRVIADVLVYTSPAFFKR